MDYYSSCKKRVVKNSPFQNRRGMKNAGAVLLRRHFFIPSLFPVCYLFLFISLLSLNSFVILPPDYTNEPYILLLQQACFSTKPVVLYLRGQYHLPDWEKQLSSYDTVSFVGSN